MATKYVEDYRSDTTGKEYTDSETIQRAVDALNDGDTLIFNKKVSEDSNEH